MPPELVLLPSWVPLNLYDWACWARQTIVPLTIVSARRPVRPLPFDLAELRIGRPARPRPRGVFTALDRALHRYERRPVPGLRQAALRRAAEWIVARQESDGSWGGITCAAFKNYSPMQPISVPFHLQVNFSVRATTDEFLAGYVVQFGRQRSRGNPVRLR